jgi:soluble lytic murein transglycosylase
MNLRRKSPAATGRIVTALLTLGLSASPPLSNVLAQPETPQSEETQPPSADAQMPGPAAAPEPVSGAVSQPRTSTELPANSSAVFDAPGMPGVRMMAPIPDKPEFVPAPASGRVQANAPASPPPTSPAPAQPTPASASDRATVAQALAASGHSWDRARSLAAQSGNPVVKTIVEWRYLLDEMGGASFDSINAFLAAHAAWPRHDALLIRAEKAMPAELSSRDVIGWYATHTPLSGIGTIRLGAALMDTGKIADGTAMVRKGWIDFTFSPFDENLIVAAHGDVLGPGEQKARLLKLLARDDLGGAKRQIRRVDSETARLANAVLQVKANPATAKQALASFPDSARTAPELLFEAAKALRRRNQNEDAWALMAQAPTDSQNLAIAERWSTERQIMARDALKVGRPELAYQFASTPALGPEAGTTFMEAEFLAGWIALRGLHKPELAYKHFDRLAKGVSLPISVARAHYWLGRSWEALNNLDSAAAEYRTASYYSATFYGQLALTNIADRPMLHMNIAAARPVASERAAFEGDDRVQALRLFSQLGDRANTRVFALAIAAGTADAKQLQMLAELVATTGDQALGVKVAKNASYSDVYLQPYLHPMVALPKFPGTAPEPALVLGLTRQESEFDAGAVSVAGARGLMQMMPASAKRAAAMYHLSYRPNDLNKPDYNMQLGMATLQENLDRWDGSYILAIASYNAGPSNVRNWVETFGDPRDAGVDPIDWVESIPFPETRNYVQRVLENLEVYRNRLNNSDQRLAILSDLYRPQTVNIATIRQAYSMSASGVLNTPAPIPGQSTPQ